MQTVLLEGLCLLLVAPVYAVLTGHGAAESLVVAAVVSVISIAWSPFHNSLWDQVELRRTGRAPSARPPVARAFHALSHEMSPLVFTAPAVMMLEGLTLSQSMAVNLGLTAVNVVATFAYFRAYDRLRPLAIRCPAGCPA